MQAPLDTDTFGRDRHPGETVGAVLGEVMIARIDITDIAAVPGAFGCLIVRAPGMYRIRRMIRHRFVRHGADIRECACDHDDRDECGESCKDGMEHFSIHPAQV